MRVKMLNLIGCGASLRYGVIRSKSGRIRQFPGLDTPRFKEVSGERIFLSTEKVRIGKNTVPKTRPSRFMENDTPGVASVLKEYGSVSWDFRAMTRLFSRSVLSTNLSKY